MLYIARTFAGAFLLSTLIACGSGSKDSGSDTNSNSETNSNSDTNNDDNSAAEELSLGVFLDLSGPVQDLAVSMEAAAMQAITEVSTSRKLLGGQTVNAVLADSTCTNTEKGVEAFQQLLLDNVSGVVGPVCSGLTTAVLNQVAVPAGMVMVSPSATSPALSIIDDNNLFFRTAPSDARQAEVLSQIMFERSIQTAAVTYVDNDYGKGFHDAFKIAYENSGGVITMSAAHEDGKADYSSDVAALSAAGGDALVVLGNSAQGGGLIVQESVNANAFAQYALGDGMVKDELLSQVDRLTSAFGVTPGGDGSSQGMKLFSENAQGFDPTSPFTAEAYDAAALILLAMQAAESSAPAIYKNKFFSVANAPGEKIYPGELAKALELLAAGTEIDYVGASNVELIGPGDAGGSYREMEVRENTFVAVRVIKVQR